MPVPLFNQKKRNRQPLTSNPLTNDPSISTASDNYDFPPLPPDWAWEAVDPELPPLMKTMNTGDDNKNSSWKTWDRNDVRPQCKRTNLVANDGINSCPRSWGAQQGKQLRISEPPNSSHQREAEVLRQTYSSKIPGSTMRGLDKNSVLHAFKPNFQQNQFKKKMLDDISEKSTLKEGSLYQLKLKEKDNSLRIISAVIESMKYWREHAQKTVLLFEILAVLDSAVTPGPYYSKTFLMRDGKNTLPCVFYEIDRELPRLIRGRVHRCVGNYDQKKNIFKCVSVRPASVSEQKTFQAFVKIVDAEMRPGDPERIQPALDCLVLSCYGASGPPPSALARQPQETEGLWAWRCTTTTRTPCSFSFSPQPKGNHSLLWSILSTFLLSFNPPLKMPTAHIHTFSMRKIYLPPGTTTDPHSGKPATDLSDTVHLGYVFYHNFRLGQTLALPRALMQMLKSITRGVKKLSVIHSLIHSFIDSFIQKRLSTSSGPGRVPASVNNDPLPLLPSSTSLEINMKTQRLSLCGAEDYGPGKMRLGFWMINPDICGLLGVTTPLDGVKSSATVFTYRTLRGLQPHPLVDHGKVIVLMLPRPPVTPRDWRREKLLQSFGIGLGIVTGASPSPPTGKEGPVRAQPVAPPDTAGTGETRLNEIPSMA
ncbi:hypothetical protein GH733_013862 [Mirounga leonina]|nr:hypothetical protein GH733_013862 [Mirounga leonina]